MKLLPRHNRLIGGITALLAVAGAVVAFAGQPDKVLAKVGDRVITLGELEAELRAIPDSVREKLMTPQNLRTYLRGMVLKELFAREAARLGLDKDAKVQAQLAEAKRRVLYSAYGEKVAGELRVDEADLASYFESHRNDFGGKGFDEVKGQVAHRVREEKLRGLWQQAEQEATKRWEVTTNEALLRDVSIPKDQAARDLEKAIQEAEQRYGPLSDEEKRALRDKNRAGVPVKR